MEKHIISTVPKMCILTLLLLLTVILQKQEVRAEDIDYASALTVNINSTITDRTNGGYYGDTKYYRFTTATDGVVQLHFQNARQGTTNTIWYMYLYDSEGVSITTETEIAGNDTDTYTPKLGLRAGTYYIEILSKYSAYVDVKYSLTIDFQASSYWEKEFNEEFLTANPIKVNTNYFGTIDYWRDEDYYKFTLPKDGYVTLHFTNQRQGDQGEYWKYGIFNASYSEIDGTVAYGNVEHNDMCPIGLAAGTYYVKVVCDHYHSSDVYTINVGYNVSAYWEKEFNDAILSADLIKLGKNYSGTLMYSSDCDYFKFQIKSKALYSITLKTKKQESSDTYWYANLYDSSYNELNQLEAVGNKTKHTMTATLAPGTYYIKIDSESVYYRDSTDTYKLKVAKYVNVISLSATKAKKTYTKGDKLSISDIKVKAGFSDGTVKDVTSKASINVSKVNMKKTGTYKIKVSYKGIKTTIKITVKAKADKKLNLKITAKKKGRTIKLKSIKGAKIVINSNKKLFYGNKKASVKTNKKGIAKFTTDTKLKSGTKLKITVTKKGYKKLTRTVII